MGFSLVNAEAKVTMNAIEKKTFRGPSLEALSEVLLFYSDRKLSYASS